MLSIRPLSEELQRVITENFNENPERMYNDVVYIREWIKTQNHIKIRTEDQYLVNILRHCKYDLELAKRKINGISALRTKYRDAYMNRDPLLPEFQEMLNAGIYLPLPKVKAPGSPGVILARASAIDPHKMNIKNVLKFALMIKDIHINENDNLLVGDLSMVDCEGASLQYTKLIDIGLLKGIENLFIGGYSAKPGGIVAMNVAKVAEFLYNKMIKYLVSAEQQKMITICSDKYSADLHEHVSLSMLPEEYGGTAGTIAELTAYWKEKVESYRDWFLEDEQYISTEMPPKPKSSFTLFGRKLSFDIV